jgi:hypothetical protein
MRQRCGVEARHQAGQAPAAVAERQRPEFQIQPGDLRDRLSHRQPGGNGRPARGAADQVEPVRQTEVGIVAVGGTQQRLDARQKCRFDDAARAPPSSARMRLGPGPNRWSSRDTTIAR